MAYQLEGTDDGSELAGLDVGTKLLQEELEKLAAQTGNWDISPGRTDGTMSLGTVVALSHAAGAVGKGIHPTVAKALDVVNLIKKPLGKIPYAGQIIELILSPWIIDSVFDTVLSIMRLIPGAGDAAGAAKKAVDAFKLVLSTASSALAGAIALARKTVVKPPLNGLGEGLAQAREWWKGATRRGPEFYDPTIHGPLGATNQRITVSTPGCGAGQYRNAAGACVPVPSCPPGQQFVAAFKRCGNVTVHSHVWPKGQAIVPSQWSKSTQWWGHAALTDLAPADQATFQTARTAASIAADLRDTVRSKVEQGVVAFKTFAGADGARMGAFFDATAQKLKIVPLPPAKKKKKRKSLWGRFTDAVDDAVDYTSDKIGDAVDATGDFLSDLWDSVSEQAVAVYNAVKEYGCALVGSDIAVALAATGAGIVASPAASAAVVSGAAAGRTGCALIEVGELVYAILKLLSRDFPKPPGLTQEKVDIARIVGQALPISGKILLPAPTKYPKGSIARFNVDSGLWTVYAPITAFGAAGEGQDANVIPPPPEGFIKIGDEVSRPIDIQAVGDERDAHWYDSKALWIGAGSVAVIGVGYGIKRKRSRSR